MVYEERDESIYNDNICHNPKTIYYIYRFMS